MTGALREILRAEGRLLPDAEGAWLRQGGALALADLDGVALDGVALDGVALDGVALDGVALDRGELHRIRFPGLEGARALAPLPDREHVACLRGDAVELVHRDRGVVAAAAIAARPNGPYRGDGPAWDGLLGAGGRLWYAGYDDAGAPLLSLFDAQLVRIDAHAPRSWRESREGERIRGWGDFGATWVRPVGAADRIGLFANVGDDFAYLVLVRGAERIEPLATRALEDGVADSTDETLRHVAFLPGGGLVACDDLGFLSAVDLATGRRRIRNARPLLSDADGRAIAPSGATAEWGALEIAGVASDAERVLVAIAAREDDDLDGVATDGFPPLVLASLDPVTLEPVAAVAPDGIDEIELLPGGVVALVRGDEVAFCRWA